MGGSRIAGFSVLTIGCLFALPIVGLLVILILRRSKARRSLSGSILLAGLTASLLTACFGFTSSTVPIAPYETSSHAYLDLIESVAIFLYFGFGLGAITASILGIPGAIVHDWLRSRRDSSKDLLPGRDAQSIDSQDRAA